MVGKGGQWGVGATRRALVYKERLNKNRQCDYTGEPTNWIGMGGGSRSGMQDGGEGIAGVK